MAKRDNHHITPWFLTRITSNFREFLRLTRDLEVDYKQTSLGLANVIE